MAGTCAVADCDRTLNARGYCGAHYQRLRRYGDAMVDTPVEPRSQVPYCHPSRPYAAKGFCRECYRADTRDITRERAHHLKRTYGIDLERYEAMYAQQDGRCAICREPKPQMGRDGLVVDHDHETSAVRGLLCLSCNSGIGLMQDDPSILRAAADYLDGEV